jgi:DNA-binding transcriptional LysR family regulator
MSTVTQTPSATPASSTASLASSAAFRTFATVFAVATTVIYVICEMRNWPLFTYHPGTNRVDLGWSAAVRDQGPAMYWYGWTLNTLVGAAVLGLLATMLPERVARRIPLSLVWIVPLAAVPILIYALRFFWRWD